MGYDAPSDPQVRFALWVGAISLLLTVLIALQLLWMRIWLAIRNRRAHAFETRWKPLLANWLAGDAVKLPILKSYQRKRFLMLWMYYHESLRGPIKVVLNDLLRQVELQPYLESLLKDGAMDDKLLAVAALGHLGEISSWDSLLKLLAHESPVLSLTTARAMVQIDTARATHDVLQAIIHRRDWPNNGISAILREAPAEFTETFIGQIDLAASEQRPYLPRLLRLFETLNHNFIPASLKHIMTHSNDARLVSLCLRLLKDPQDLDLARNRLADPDWQVQVQAASVVGRLGDGQDLPALRQLLSSREWWVRYRAAQAIMALPGIRPAQREELLEKEKDPYARDILRHVMAEKAVA